MGQRCWEDLRSSQAQHASYEVQRSVCLFGGSIWIAKEGVSFCQVERIMRSRKHVDLPIHSVACWGIFWFLRLCPGKSRGPTQTWVVCYPLTGKNEKPSGITCLTDRMTCSSANMQTVSLDHIGTYSLLLKWKQHPYQISYRLLNLSPDGARFRISKILIFPVAEVN